MGNDDHGARTDVVRNLLLDAARLGFEVGYLGHIEGVGWVKNRLRDLEAQAAEFGILDDMTGKYNLAKELGKKRRVQMSLSSAGKRQQAEEGPALEFENLATTMKLRAEEKIESVMGRALRVAPAESIAAVANLYKVAERSHWVQRQVNIAFSGVADLHDLLGEVESDEQPERILERGLEILKSVGWISDYSVVEFNPGAKMARVEATSRIPKEYGTGPDPICKNLSLALEAIATKAFGCAAQAVEKGCICQGEKRCRFVILSRS